MTRNGTAEPVSRDQILRRERGQGKLIFPVQLTTSRISNLTWLILTLAICDDHTFTYIHTYEGGGRVAARLFFLFFFSPVQQATSGIGNRVK